MGGNGQRIVAEPSTGSSVAVTLAVVFAVLSWIQVP
jgi:hypothetical protein